MQAPPIQLDSGLGVILLLLRILHQRGANIIVIHARKAPTYSNITEAAGLAGYSGA